MISSRYIVEKEIKKIIKRVNAEEALLAAKNGNVALNYIRNFHPHSIRHTFATRCAERGVDVKVAQKILGHSNITITMQIYQHVSDSRMTEELKKLASVDDYNKTNQSVVVSSKSHF